MRRTAMGLILITGWVGVARAQLIYDQPAVYPITSPVEDAGVFDWEHKQWLSATQAAQFRATSIRVYNNTCTWTGGNGFDAVDRCVTFFDEGRIPGGVGGTAPQGASADNLIDSFEIAYCTKSANGTLDVKIGFYENWGGCLQNLGGTAYSPPLANLATGYFDLGAPAGFPLPGDPTPGGAWQCWKFTLALGNNAFCMLSDGDGFYDNTAALDAFAWSFENDTAFAPPNLPPNAQTAPLRTGDPGLSPVSGCTYNVACGSDPSPWTLFGPAPQACGHGLDTEDHWWMNIDGDLWGDAVNTSTGQTCATAPGSGSNCYWYGGYPTAQFSSYWLVLTSAGPCAGCNGTPLNYCTPGTSTNGCTPTMSLNGTPSASNTGTCFLTASNVEGQKNGLIFVGYGQNNVPWSSTSTSFFCIKTPVVRVPPSQNSGGTVSQCNGTIATDINAYVASQGGTLLGVSVSAGLAANAQGWYRDPLASKATNLTDGVTWVFCP